MLPAHSDNEPQPNKIISPFANQEAVPPKGKSISLASLGLWASILFLLVAAGAGSAFFFSKYFNDPYRTIESFPVGKYLESYRSLAGSKFKAEMRVEADLGWKENSGKLMLFSITGDSRPVAIFIPANIAKDIYFSKGQTYMAEVEVKEGGLIYANSCRKN